VATWVKSATQQRFGALATKSRSTRSGALGRGDHSLAADGAGDAELAHQPFDGAAGHSLALAVQVPPDLPGAVDTVVGVVCLLDHDLQLGVTDGAGRGCLPALVVGVVGGRGDLAVVLGQNTADRLDSAEAVPVLVDERYERVCGRPSSAMLLCQAARLTGVGDSGLRGWSRRAWSASKAR
jgi:hypothetical protein